MTTDPLPMGEAPPPSRGARSASAALLGVALLAIGLFALNPYPVGVLHDDAVYVILARALATGHGYRYLNLPGEPFATHFPPGYPVFLAALWKLAPGFPGNVLLFKIANAALLVVSYVLLGRLLRRRGALSSRGAWGLAFIAVAGVPLLLVSTLVLSETLFLAIVIAALTRAERTTGERASARALVITGVAFGIATLVRTPGLALIAGTAAVLLLKRRPRDAGVVVLVSLVVILPWQLWAARHGHDVPDVLQGAYGSYSGWLGAAVRAQGVGFVFRTLALTVQQATTTVLDAVAPFESLALRVVTGIIWAILCVIGFAAGWRRLPALLAFLVVYVGIVLIWPSPPARYVWGMWPLFVVVPALGLIALVRARPARRAPNVARGAVLLISLLPLVGYAKYNVSGYLERSWLDIPRQGGLMLRPIVTGIRDNTPPNAVVAATAEAAVFLYAERRTTPIYSFTVDEFFRGPDLATQSRALADILRSYPVDFVVASSEFQRSAIQRLPAPYALVPVDSFAGGIVYRRALPSPSAR